MDYKNFIYIVTSNFAWRSGPIKVFDLNGKLIEELSNSNEEAIYIESYYDNKLSTNYILACNKGHIKSYDPKKYKLFQTYNTDERESLYEDFTFNNIG